MNAAAISLDRESLSTDSIPFFGRNSLTGIEQKPTAFLSPTVEESAPIRQNIETEALLNKNAAGELLLSFPPTLELLFDRAEKQLSLRTEITAQYALKLIRRIKTLAASISAGGIQGRVIAFVDDHDNSITVEWIGMRSRVGFCLDPGRESSWFIVLPDGSSRSGDLYGPNGLKSLRGLLEEFLAAVE